mgnify:CR=1 FL=1
MANTIRAKVTIKGTRTMLQHRFGPEAIPLEKGERTGVAGNDPEEWKKTRMVADDGRLFVPGTYIFSCLKSGAIHTKRGRASMQAPLVSTLQVEEDVIYLNRKQPDPITQQFILSPPNDEIFTFVYVATVRNPATKGRNVRYRLATRAGWKITFTLNWDKTIVARDQMKAILRDSGMLGGLGDGIKIGCGRFEVIKYEELGDATETPAERDMDAHEGNGVAKRRGKVLAV